MSLHYERQRRPNGHDVQLTCAPHGGQPARRLTVEDVALVLSPAVSATPRPPPAGSRRLRRCATLLTRSVSSSRLTPTTPCRRLRFIEICGTLQVFGMIVLQEDKGSSRVNGVINGHSVAWMGQNVTLAYSGGILDQYRRFERGFRSPLPS